MSRERKRERGKDVCTLLRLVGTTRPVVGPVTEHRLTLPFSRQRAGKPPFARYHHLAIVYVAVDLSTAAVADGEKAEERGEDADILYRGKGDRDSSTMFKRKPVMPEIGKREREGDDEKDDLRKRDGDRERK